MAINPVSASTSSVTATEALRAQQEANAVQRAERERQTQNESSKTVEQQAPTPKPTVNTRGETIGTRINIAA